MNSKSIATIFCTLIIACFAVQCKNQPENQNPNVIVIYTDDLGYGDVTCYNPGSKINTPNIDKLASQGMMFTDAHSAASFCTPSRYSILTGRYCWRSEITSKLQGGYDLPIIRDDEMTLGKLFKNNGYATAAIGKWHVGMKWTLKDGETEQEEENIDFSSPLQYTPVDQGFDYYFGTSGCTSDDPPFAFIENRKLLGFPLDRVNDLNVVGDGDYLKDALIAKDWAHEKADTIFTNKAIKFMQTAAGNKEPFFVYLALSLPHIPWLPAEFVKGTTGAGPRGDLVALADYCVGEIVESLKRLDIEENTIIVFTSDNGPREGVNGHRSAGDLRGFKGDIYEGGHRVPFILKWPGKIASGSSSDDLIGQVDLYATFAGIINSQPGANDAPDSHDFSSVLLGQAPGEPIRDELIQLGFAIRKGDWKLIFDLPDRDDVSEDTVIPEELYNLKNDPGESENLIDQHPEIVSELKSDFIKSYQQDL